MGVNTIEEVIDRASEIIEICKAEENPMGYFAALYRNVTKAVKEKIDEGNYFDDNEMLTKLDVNFANRFIDAWDEYKSGELPTRSWLVAFEAAATDKYVIMQHLGLGINAHINLDLGIAAARTAPKDLDKLEADFKRVNDLLFSLVHEVEQDINSLSPWYKLWSKYFKEEDEAIIKFSIKAGRKFAWKVARELAPLDLDDQLPIILKEDKEATLIGNLIRNPGILGRIAVWLIRRRESKNVKYNIEVLAD